MRSGFVGLIFVCLSVTTACEAQKADSGEVFRSDYAHLTIELPCKAKETRRDTYPYAVGERFGYEWACEIDGRRYVITYGDHNPETPESVETFLNYSKGDIEIALKDSLRSTEAVSIDGRKGYKFLYSNRKKLTALTANQRGILHMNMIRKDGTELTDSDRQIFEQILGSVQFTDK